MSSSSTALKMCIECQTAPAAIGAPVALCADCLEKIRAAERGVAKEAGAAVVLHQTNFITITGGSNSLINSSIGHGAGGGPVIRQQPSAHQPTAAELGNNEPERRFC